jgi:hypothetical protein
MHRRGHEVKEWPDNKILRPQEKTHRVIISSCVTKPAYSLSLRIIDLQKMNWKFRTGVHEQMGVFVWELSGQGVE